MLTLKPLTLTAVPNPTGMINGANPLTQPAKDAVHFGNQGTKQSMPIELLTNKATPVADIQLKWLDQTKGTFMFVNRHQPDAPLAEGRMTPNSGVALQAFDGKGGFSVIVSTPKAKYVLMPGSHYAEGDNFIQLTGKTPSSQGLPPAPEHTHHKTPPQQHTNVGMILGAGLSSRIEPIPTVTHAAKPAFLISQNASIIGRSAAEMKRHGINTVLVNTFFKPSTTQSALDKAAKDHDFTTHYLDESKLGDAPSGTAGGLLRVLQDPKLRKTLGDKPMLLMAGDSLMNFDLSDLVNRHMANNAGLTLAGYKVDDADLDKFGIITTDTGHSGDITGFVEKPGLQPEGLKKIGSSRLGNTFVHVISPELYPVIEAMAKDPAFIKRQQDPKAINPGLDFAMDIYPKVMELVNKGELTRNGKPLTFRAEEVKGYWSDVGNPAAYFHAVDALHAGHLGDKPVNEHFYKNGIAFWDKDAHDHVMNNKVTVKGNAIVSSHAQDE
jgi:NDP-sugar pyrophosphorylase family protein